MKLILAALAIVALPALAEPGFFDAVRAHDKVLRRSQCTARQVLVCEIRCPGTALADGKPAAQACDVSECRCEDGKIDRPPQSLVIFGAGKMLGLPVPK
jgi:hypothetical protein